MSVLYGIHRFVCVLLCHVSKPYNHVGVLLNAMCHIQQVVSYNIWQAGASDPSLLKGRKAVSGKNWKCTNLSKPFFETDKSTNTPIGL